MTVAPQQNEPGPAQYPPPPQYSTAPPWAPAPEPQGPPAQPPVPYQYGQLLVAYPEEMTNAGRPRPPSWVPVVVFTFFFGVLALWSVNNRVKQAKRGRNSVTPYWVAWGATMAASALLGVAVAPSVQQAFLDYRESAITTAVESNLVHDGQMEQSGVKLASASCTPRSDRVSAGLRRYYCLLTLEDGRAGSMSVIADEQGAWKAIPEK